MRFGSYIREGLISEFYDICTYIRCTYLFHLFEFGACC